MCLVKIVACTVCCLIMLSLIGFVNLLGFMTFIGLVTLYDVCRLWGLLSHDICQL